MKVQDLMKRIQKLEVLTNRKVNDIFVGNYKSAFKGRGIEFADIREYDENDDFRNIDWITSAKQNKLFVKTYHETRELTTMMLVDLSSSMNFTSTGRTKKEIALELLTMLCFSALKNNDKMGAIFFTDKIEAFLPPRKGSAQMWRILRTALLGFEKNAYTKADLSPVLQFLNRVFRRSSICFLISDDLEPNPTLEKHLHVSNRTHDFVFVRVVDPFEKGIVRPERIEAEDPETGEKLWIDLSDKAVAERYRTQRQKKESSLQNLLRKTRIDWVEIGPEDSIFKKMFLFFKQRQAQY